MFLLRKGDVFLARRDFASALDGIGHRLDGERIVSNQRDVAGLPESIFGMASPDGLRTLAEAAHAYGSMDDVLDALERVLAASAYIAGEAFTAADVVVGSQIGWGMMFGTIEKRPAFEDYVGRLQSRPAAIRANELDDAAMPQQQPSPQPA